MKVCETQGHNYQEVWHQAQTNDDDEKKTVTVSVVFFCNKCMDTQMKVFKTGENNASILSVR